MKTLIISASIAILLIVLWFSYQWYFKEIGIAENQGARIYQKGSKGGYYLQSPDGRISEITKSNYEKYIIDSTLIPSNVDVNRRSLQYNSSVPISGRS